MADSEKLCNAYKKKYGNLPNPTQLISFSKQRGSPMSYMAASDCIMQYSFSQEYSGKDPMPSSSTSLNHASSHQNINRPPSSVSIHSLHRARSHHNHSRSTSSQTLPSSSPSLHHTASDSPHHNGQIGKRSISHRSVANKSKPLRKHGASKSVTNVHFNPYQITRKQTYQITRNVPVRHHRKQSRSRAPSTTFGASFAPKRSYQFVAPKYINNRKQTFTIVPKSKHNAAPKQEEKEEEKGDIDMAKWLIMGDLLYSIQYSFICTKNEIKDFKCVKNKQKQNKPHLDSRHYESTTFLFKEYAASLFAELRAKWLKCDILSDEYVKKLFGRDISVNDLNVDKACKDYWRRLSTNSKSGQIFFQTLNGEYIIKSMPKSEADFFRKNVLQHYHEYMMSATDSLLTKILGFYKIQHAHEGGKLQSDNEYNSKRKLDANKGIYVIVMKSILFCKMTPTAKIHQIYDLKGSKHNRTASRYKLKLDKKTLDALNIADGMSYEEEINDIANEDVIQLATKYARGCYEPKTTEKKEKFKEDKISCGKGNICVWKRSKVLKDMDFIQDDERINIGQRLRTKYMKQLRNDLDFLTRMNVMDYSLLVGIHTINTVKINRSHTKPKRSGHKCNLFNFEFGGMCNDKVMINNKKNIYFTGIIDFLQEYNAKKKLESYYKRVKYEGKDVISSVDAKTYANRLYAFIEKRTI